MASNNNVLNQAIQQVRAYYASPQYDAILKKNQQDTKEFLLAQKQRCKLEDNVLTQKFTI
jgi:hypothetical protein